MIKVNYTALAKEPLFHGSDNMTSGNKRMFRRERHKIHHPEKILSTFDNDEMRRYAALSILFGVYKSIDSKLKSDYYGYYEPFLANILAATHNRTKFEFLNSICESCGVRSIHSEHADAVMISLARFSDSELMYTMHRETQYLMLMLRDFVKNNQSPALFDRVPNAPANYFEKQFEDIPYISGNAIGGLMRRLAVRDWFVRIGYDREKLGVEKGVYHELMTGGNISESTGAIDIEKKERTAWLCPPVGVLGSALGSMTTTSLVKIGSLRPVCRELGDKDAPSFWELLGVSFGTRHDTSKSEMDIAVVSSEAERNADQMIYYNEVLNAGTSLKSEMLLTSDDPLMVSCFWHIIELWKEFGYIAARSARGYGAIDIHVEIPEGANALYLSHLETVKADALKHFTVQRAVKDVAVPE